MMLKMPVHRRPPAEKRLSTLEELVAELAIQVAKMREILNAKLQ